MEVPNYRKLIVWQKAHQNALLIIEILDRCDAKYSRLVQQCLAASTSVGANIAEGNSAHTSKEKKRYFEIALNSSYEFDNWLQILKDSKVFKIEPVHLNSLEQSNIEVIKILTTLIKSLTS